VSTLVKFVGDGAAVFASLKVGLHYGDYRSKLVPFEEQKNIFHI
jgi:hypothetical protein